MPILAMSAGTVTGIWGNAYIRLPNGKLQPLKVGDKVKGGQHIVTEDNGIVQITPEKGPPVAVASKPAEPVEQAIAAIEADDPLEAPAAGLQGGAGGGLLPGLRVDRVQEGVSPLSYQYGTERDPSGFPIGSTADQRELPANEPPSPPTAPPQIDLDANDSVAPGTGYAGLALGNGKAVAIVDTDVLITDADSTNLQGATVVLTNPQAGDTLNIGTLPAGITATLSADGNTITLSGSATLAAYQDALRAITFQSKTGDPSTTPRLIEVTVTDGTNTSNTAVSTITVQQPPVLLVDAQGAVEGKDLGFTLALTRPIDEPVTVKLALKNGTDLPGTSQNESGTVGVDTATTLYYEASPGNWVPVPASGELTFAPGQQTINLKLATIDDLLIEPSEFVRLEVDVVAGPTRNASAANEAEIIDNDTAPVLDLDGDDSSGAVGSGYQTSYVGKGQGVAVVDADVVVKDEDGTPIQSATVTLTNAQPGDKLSVGPLPAGLSATVVDNVVTITGSASAADYQTALRAIRFSNDNADVSTTPRSLDVVVSDGANVSNTATTVITVQQPPVLLVDAQGAVEGKDLGFTIALTQPVNEPVTVKLTLKDGTDLPGTSQNESATVGVDTATALYYEASPGNWLPVPASGELTFAPGQQTINLKLATEDDLLVEADEFVRLEVDVIAGPTRNASAANEAQILDNDTAPVLDLDADDSAAPGSGYAATFTEDGEPVGIVDADVSISDDDGTPIQRAEVTLLNPQSGDALLVIGEYPSNLTLTIVDGGTRVVITGSAPPADYQTALRAIGFHNTSDTPVTTPREISVVVSDGVNDSNVATSVIAVTAVNDAPVVKPSVGDVSEEGLPKGLADNDGTGDNTDSAVHTGQIVMTDPDGDLLTVSFVAPSTPVYVVGSSTPISWTPDGAGGLIGQVGSQVAATLEVGEEGAYTFTLKMPLQHAAQGEDVLPIVFGVRVSDGQATTESTLTIRVQDDAPAEIAPQSRDVAALDTNLLIVLDTSSSMRAPSGINEVDEDGGISRLAAAVQAIGKLLDRYDDFGNVAVRLVTFNNTAQTVGDSWLTVNQAKALLATVTVNGATNYDFALQQAMTAFGTPEGKLGNAQNVAYFLSDGNPTLSSRFPNPGAPQDGNTTQPGLGDGIDANEEAVWRSFLLENQIKSYAIGMGREVETRYLNPIAYDGHAGVDADGVVVQDFAQLESVLNTTASEFATGNLAATGALEPAMGADGFQRVESITVDGKTYFFDPAQSSLQIQTSLGGTLTVNMLTGDYRYAAPPAVVGKQIEQFGFTLSDGDGDRVDSVLTINVDKAQVISGTAADNTLTGSNGADVIYGGGGNDILLGGAGNDLIYGGEGNDRIVGGKGNDILIGGPGKDVFEWRFGDQGASGSDADRAVDTIRDFNTLPASAGGDVLDLRDLLQGENTAGGTGNLDSYLRFEQAGADTIIHVSPTGDFTGIGGGTESQRIVLEGVNLRADLSLSSGSGDVEVIAKLLEQGKLLVDNT